jgi:hypothetical protein
MKLKIYENSIIAPLKCGTRFLDSIWKPLPINETNLYLHCSSEIKKYIVLRPPLEHFKSAIQTETIGILKENYNKDDFDKLLKLIDEQTEIYEMLISNNNIKTERGLL